MKKYILFATIGLFLFTSCFDELLEEKVYSDVSAEIFEDSKESADLLVSGVLNTLSGGQFHLYMSYFKISEFDTDDMIAGDWALKTYGAGNFTEDPYDIDNWWRGRYALIYRCNYAIEKIEKMTSFDPEVKNNMLGQMLFLKAWSYFQLVQAYGEVPIHRKKVFTPEEYQVPRSPISEVYAHIIELLNESGSLLMTRSNPKYETGRISKFAAKTLLASVYCAMGSGSLPQGTEISVIGGPAERLNSLTGVTERIEYPISVTHQKDKVAGYDFNPAECYTRVRELCDSIINSGEFSLFSNYADIWKVANRNGQEFIWQLQANASIDYLRNTLGGDISGYYDERNNGRISGALYGLRSHWYRLFESQDLRAREGVMHLFARYLVGGTGPHKDDPWWFFFPQEDSLRIITENPGMFDASYGITFNNELLILTKFQGVSDNTQATSDFHYPFLRYPIVYLMLAEAECELGNLQRAKEMVDVVRARAMATQVASMPSTQTEVRSFILEERRRELAFEGVRKWDLLRWGIYLQVMNAVDKDGTIIKRRQSRNLLFPIPISELNANKALNNKNNPGW
ncbi:MAG: RagB/SusD family nutrient uptake outer membrane protein [Dysgonamonadaceae bacterium]|jgi:hypothetical protein|nr:RagB/SusD family nutrient uptake outer membrane protein [Dysgonamonadaceae bacterium]